MFGVLGWYPAVHVVGTFCPALFAPCLLSEGGVSVGGHEGQCEVGRSLVGVHRLSMDGGAEQEAPWIHAEVRCLGRRWDILLCCYLL